MIPDRNLTRRDLIDELEKRRLRTFSELGIKPPRSKKEKHKLAAMLKRLRKSC
jgi:hypothetical protein